MDQNLAGKIAIVTGGSRGIGQAIAVRLARSGALVSVGGLHDISATRALVEAAGVPTENLLFTHADVNSQEDVETLVKATIDRFGKVDILVNNAGINRDGLLLRMKLDDWDAVLNTNLRGAFLCTQKVLSGMVRSRWGRIINISSVVGVAGNPGQANYAAAKAGIIGLTKTTAREVASRNITVNAVAPGFIDTDMTSGLSEQVRDRLRGQIPQARFGSPDDVADLVEFLASDRSAYITGQVINVDGGMFMT